MPDQICTIAMIQEKARAAFAAGLSIDAHNMNWHAPALATWQAEFARCEVEAALVKASDRETV